MSNFSLEYAIEQFPHVLKAVPLTLLIAVIAMLLGMGLGFLIALCRMYKIPVLYRMAVVYVSFIRGTPLLVQIYVIYFGLPELLGFLNGQFGWGLPADEVPPLVFALLAFTINSSAYQSEAIRAGLEAVEAGQLEASYSVGMTPVQAMLRVIGPQAFAVALPNFGNIFIGLIKGTSLAFTVKVIEIMAVSKVIAGNSYRYLEMYLDAAIVYWIICMTCEKLFAMLEARMNRHERTMSA